MGKNRKKTATKDKKTSRKGWTNDEQYEYLTSQIPIFVNAQSSKTTADQWPAIYEEWFKRWPIGEPTQKEIEQGLTEDDRVKAVKMVSDTLLSHSACVAYHSINRG
jgi:hypothetical protein